MDDSLPFTASVKRLDRKLWEAELHAAAGRDRLTRQTQSVAQAEQEGRDTALARQLLLAMFQTQENLEGAVRHFKALAEGLASDSKLIGESELAVIESFNAIGGDFSGSASLRDAYKTKADPAEA